jgi:hypothetical protein
MLSISFSSATPSHQSKARLLRIEGLVGYLTVQARENPVAFMGLLGELVPSQIAAEVTQGVAPVTDNIMTPEEWAEQWAERAAH